MSIKNSDTIWNRTRDLLACSAVSQPTALQRAPMGLVDYLIKKHGRKEISKLEFVCHGWSQIPRKMIRDIGMDILW
jgi:hypothetical protein